MIEAARPATAAELPRLVELHRAATEELRAERGGPMWATTTARDGEPDLAAHRDDLLVLAGTLDDVVVGYARVERQSLPDGTLLAVLTDIYVEPEARGVGVGEALLDAVVAWARDAGCRGIDAHALPGMRETKNFFEAAGMVTRLLTVHRAL